MTAQPSNSIQARRHRRPAWDVCASRSGTQRFPHVLERHLHVRDVLVAARRILAQAARDDAREIRGNRRREAAHRCWIVAEDLRERRATRITRRTPAVR